ncbi:MAG TPA: ABC transporter permease [Micromonosporaceae bacterium]|nr:ABC transporter permease [Micromonosporaceae bacterium]
MTAATLPAQHTERRVPPLGGFNLTFLGLELRRMLRNRRTMVFVIVMPVVFYLLFGRKGATIVGTSLNYRTFEMVSLALYGAMTACVSGGSMVAVERALGWSRQLRLTPLRPVAYVSIKILTAMTLGLVPIALLFVFGALQGVRLPAHEWILCALAVAVGSLVFATLGLFMGYLLPSENVMQFLGPILGVLAFLGGVFIPVNVLSPSLVTVAKFMPVYGVNQLAHAPLGTGLGWEVFANIAIWLAIFVGGSALLFRRDTRRV